jgi:hypothetical protein
LPLSVGDAADRDFSKPIKSRIRLIRRSTSGRLDDTARIGINHRAAAVRAGDDCLALDRNPRNRSSRAAHISACGFPAYQLRFLHRQMLKEGAPFEVPRRIGSLIEEKK